jgi:ketosteroid isomerase-like protein
MADGDRFARAQAAIDAANAQDPTAITVRGREGPKELLHAELVTEWVRYLCADPDEALMLAARGHHFRRWTSPRATYPAGRAGYLRWRRALQEQQARELGDLLAETGYDTPTIERVQRLVRKQGVGDPADADAQALEDALCLVFLETQLGDIVQRLEPETLSRVLSKTARKMSAGGRRAIADVPLDPGVRALLDGALAHDVVSQYLDGLRAHDWDSVAATLAPEVERIGPYRDVYQGRDAYAGFLAETISKLEGYELVVDRIVTDGTTVVVELSETVDDSDARLRTQEAVVFDVDAGAITRVAVYLQTSERIPLS